MSDVMTVETTATEVPEVPVVEDNTATEVPVVEDNTVPVNPYKKTNRVRKAKLHETLETSLRITERALMQAGVADVSIEVERNNDPSVVRYARAIFDVTFNVSDPFEANRKSIPIRGKTAEEIITITQGIRLALDLIHKA